MCGPCYGGHEHTNEARQHEIESGKKQASKQASGHSVYAFVPVAIPGRHISIKLARPRSKLKE